jgi:hypothetical protein
MLSGRLQGFIPWKWARLQDHILTLHTRGMQEGDMAPKLATLLAKYIL